MAYTKKDDNLYNNAAQVSTQALSPSAALASAAAEDMIKQSGSGAGSVQPVSSGITGDLNGDGKVTAADSRIVGRYASGNNDNLADWQKQMITDMYGNKPRVTDANQLLKYSAKLTDQAGLSSKEKNARAVQDYRSSAEQLAYELIEKGPYAESQSVIDTRDRYNALNSNRPGDYVSKYDSEINSIIESILNRGDFDYNYEDDPLYRQYAESYTAGADKAMNNAMSTASARTSGYGNSYAVGASNAAYQQYMAALSDKIPELRQQAYNEWLNSGNELYNQYNLLANRDNADYGRYRDSVSDWNTDRSFAADDYRDEKSFDYSKHNDDLNNIRSTAALAQSMADSLENSDRWQEQFDYTKDRDAVSDSKWQQEIDTSKDQFDRTLAYQQAQDAAEMEWAKEQYWNDFNNISAYQQAALNKSGSSGGSSKSGGLMNNQTVNGAEPENNYTQNAKDWEFKNIMTVNDFGWTREGESTYAGYVKKKLNEGVANGYITDKEAAAIAENLNYDKKTWSY